MTLLTTLLTFVVNFSIYALIYLALCARGVQKPWGLSQLCWRDLSLSLSEVSKSPGDYLTCAGEMAGHYITRGLPPDSDLVKL